MVDCSWLMSKCLINYCHSEYFSVRLPPIYLYYPKGEKMDSQKQPYLQVFLKFSIIQIRPMNLFMVECSTRCQNISERAKDTLEIYAVINHMWSLMPTKIQTCTKVIHTKYYKHLVYVLQGSTYQLVNRPNSKFSILWLWVRPPNFEAKIFGLSLRFCVYSQNVFVLYLLRWLPLIFEFWLLYTMLPLWS